MTHMIHITAQITLKTLLSEKKNRHERTHIALLTYVNHPE